MTDSDALNQSTQSKYKKIRNNTKQPEIADNEVRITTSGKVKKYVDYSLRLLQGPTEAEKQKEEREREKSKEETSENPAKEESEESRKPMGKFATIVLKATGRAINHAVTTAEVVKRKIGGLHQVTALDTLEINDTWEPLEEGLKTVITTRRVASITIKLTKNGDEIKEEMDNGIGYQSPINSETLGARRSTTRNRDRQNYYPSYNYNNRNTRRDNRDAPRRQGGYRGNRGYNRGYQGGRRPYDNRRQNNRGYGRDNRDNRDSRDNRDNRDNRDYRGGRRGGGRNYARY